MKKEIHPQYGDTKVTCGCGETFMTRSTVPFMLKCVLYATRSTPASSASSTLVAALRSSKSASENQASSSFLKRPQPLLV